MSIVEAEGLTKRFGNFTAVDGIGFSVKRAEFLVIVGPNGAGKTSVIRMIYGFSPVTEGEMRVFGLPIETSWRAIRSRPAVCQQETTLDPDLTVQENLWMHARYFGMKKRGAQERTEELLRFLALTAKRQSKVSALSGGLARRLQLARALISRPELLILDEPTAGLDPQSRQQVWDRLLALKAEGLTLLLTTHYMAEAEMLSDRIIIMDRGRIIAEGGPAALIERHARGEVIEIDNPGRGLRAHIESQNLRVEDLGHRVIVYAPPDGDGARAVHDALRKTGQRHVTRKGSIEDVFLRLTGRELRE